MPREEDCGYETRLSYVLNPRSVLATTYGDVGEGEDGKEGGKEESKLTTKLKSCQALQQPCGLEVQVPRAEHMSDAGCWTTQQLQDAVLPHLLPRQAERTNYLTSLYESREGIGLALVALGVTMAVTEQHPKGNL